MIQADGIMAFRGKLIYQPPNPAVGKKEYVGDFVHRQFDPDEGYWYGCGHSFDDRYCEVVEASDLVEEFAELSRYISSLKDIVVSVENVEQALNIFENIDMWMACIKSEIGG